MTQPGYQEGGERMWWWKTAQYLDAAMMASVNAMAHNVDGQASVFDFQEKLRQAQVILLEIFTMKGIVKAAPPNGANGHVAASTVMTEPAVPEHILQAFTSPLASDGPVETPVAPAVEEPPAAPIPDTATVSDPAVV